MKMGVTIMGAKAVIGTSKIHHVTGHVDVFYWHFFDPNGLLFSVCHVLLSDKGLQYGTYGLMLRSI